MIEVLMVLFSVRKIIKYDRALINV